MPEAFEVLEGEVDQPEPTGLDVAGGDTLGAEAVSGQGGFSDDGGGSGGSGGGCRTGGDEGGSVPLAAVLLIVALATIGRVRKSC